jgi:hypothetical protein
MSMDSDKIMFIKCLSLVLILYLILKIFIALKNNFYIYSFSDFGSAFDLNYGDYIKFNFNIRTDDALDDCKIKGMYSNGSLSSIDIQGDGVKCKILRENNKLGIL